MPSCVALAFGSPSAQVSGYPVAIFGHQFTESCSASAYQPLCLARHGPGLIDDDIAGVGFSGQLPAAITIPADNLEPQRWVSFDFPPGFFPRRSARRIVCPLGILTTTRLGIGRLE